MKILFITPFLFFMACMNAPLEETVETKTYEYQSEQTGKQFQYFHKPSRLSDKKTLNAFTLSGFSTNHFFTHEESKHYEISYDYAFEYKKFLYGINVFAYKGSMNVNTEINEIKYDEFLTYHGYGARLNFAPKIIKDDFSIYPLNLQFALAYEAGDFFDWRKSISNEYINVNNQNSKNWTFSMYYVPEILYNYSETINMSFYAGLGNYHNTTNDVYSVIYGLMFRYKSTAISWSRSQMQYDHKTYTGSYLKPNDLSVSKMQNRFIISYLF